MPKHIKPSADELKENVDKVLDELDSLKDAPVEETPEEEPEVAPVVEEVKEEVVEEVVEPEPSKEIIKDVLKREKEKNIASAQEAQILHAKNKKINEALENALNAPDATEDELQKEYPDWDMMSDFEKKMAKDSMNNYKRLRSLDEIVKENKDLESWSTKVDDFVKDPANLTNHPELDGKEDEFKLFATKPSRRNVDFEDIVPAFLYGIKPQPKSKGQMFEVGSGGSNENLKPKGDKINLEEARNLRTTDYKKYAELLKSGKIEVEL